MRGPQSIVIPPSVEETSTLTPQKNRKTCSQSLVLSPIFHLEGNNKHASSESEIEPDPEPETLRSMTLNPSPVLCLNLTQYPCQIWITLCLDIA